MSETLDDGLLFDGYIQPPDVPPDPTGNDWRGPPGPPGPPGPGLAPSDVPPLMDAAAVAGSSTAYARGDHAHPSDTSRLPLAGGTLTHFRCYSRPIPPWRSVRRRSNTWTRMCRPEGRSCRLAAER